MNSIAGTWQLVSATSTLADGTAMPGPYGGESAMGLIHLKEDGSMMAVLCDSRVSLPAEKTREFISYCGTYRYDGKQLATQVYATSRSDWLATEQIRDVAFEGDIMVLRPPLRAYAAQPEQRVLYWRKIAG